MDLMQYDPEKFYLVKWEYMQYMKYVLQTVGAKFTSTEYEKDRANKKAYEYMKRYIHLMPLIKSKSEPEQEAYRYLVYEFGKADLELTMDGRYTVYQFLYEQLRTMIKELQKQNIIIEHAKGVQLTKKLYPYLPYTITGEKYLEEKPESLKQLFEGLGEISKLKYGSWDIYERLWYQTKLERARRSRGDTEEIQDVENRYHDFEKRQKEQKEVRELIEESRRKNYPNSNICPTFLNRRQEMVERLKPEIDQSFIVQKPENQPVAASFREELGREPDLL